jgi:peptide subunit release factor 1 (eRF1)
MESDFLAALDQATRQRVAGSFGCDTNATSAEVAEAAVGLQREVEAREELQTLGKVQELLSTRAVAGLDDTLDMLNQQRVMTLIVDDAATLPGGIDRESGMLTTQTEGTYEATGGQITPVPDLVDLMLDKAMEQGATLELVRSEAAREALAPHGPAAALLRF